jgi:hypothetical protein
MGLALERKLVYFFSFYIVLSKRNRHGGEIRFELPP